MESTTMADIVITKSSNEPGAKSLKVEVALERVEAAERKAASYYAKRIRMPGFRKGKAPLAVIRKKYRDAIRQNVIQELLDASWKAAIDQENLKPIADPQIKNLKFEPGAPITFDLMVAVKPEINLTRLGQFALTRKISPVSDAMVDAQLEDMRRQRAPWTPVDDAAPKHGELVSVTITPLEQDQPQESREYQLVIGQGQALPDIEDRLMQMRSGDTVDSTVRFPDDFDDEAKRGSTRSVRISLHEIKRQDLPELDDAFAREVGDFDSAEALRASVRKDLEEAARRQGDAEVRHQLIDQIAEANTVEAPRPMVQRVMRAFAEAYQVPDDGLERFAAEFAPVAERQVKHDLIIDHVAERKKLRATEEDIDNRIEQIAKRRNTEPRQVYASLEKAKRIAELERNLTEEKVFSYLLEQSTVTDEKG